MDFFTILVITAVFLLGVSIGGIIEFRRQELRKEDRLELCLERLEDLETEMASLRQDMRYEVITTQMPVVTLQIPTA